MTYDDFLHQWLSESNAIECYTSGSTGSPSRIILPKSEMLRSAQRTADFFELNSHSHLHSCISPDFIGGKMMLIRSQLLGCHFSWEHPSNQPLCDPQLKDSQLSLVSIVPSQMDYILQNVARMPVVDNYLIGGQAINDSLRKRIIEKRLTAWESYGMTETSSHIAIRKVADGEVYFHTLSGISVSLSEQNTLKINIEGWQELTTNDYAELRSPTEFKILGRLDNVIISGGRKIHIEEIENKLSKKISVAFFCCSEPDKKWGQRLVLLVQRSNLDSKILKQELSDICKEILEPWQRPKEIYILESLPLTASGKPKRNIL